MAYKLVRSIGRNHSSRASYGYGSTITGITIHHWGSTGQKHQNVVDWLKGTTGNRGSSAHYVVSDGLVTQIVEDNRAAWHGGNNRANGTTIGIEMRPEMTAGDWATLVELCVNLERKHGSMKYYGHKDWKNTACPGKYYPRLGELVRAVNEMHKTGKVPEVEPGGGGSTGGGGGGRKYSIVGPDEALGLYDRDGNGRRRIADWQEDALGYTGDDADGYFGPGTERDTKALQRQIGLTGADVDGMVGPQTIAAWEAAGKPKLSKSKPKPAPKPEPKDVPGPGHAFPWPSGHYIGPKDGPDRSRSGFYDRTAGGRTDRQWIQEFVRQLGRRGWSVGKGKSYLTRYGNDGLYGDELAALIRAFQGEQGLTVDGLGGEQTWTEAFHRPVT